MSALRGQLRSLVGAVLKFIKGKHIGCMFMIDD